MSPDSFALRGSLVTLAERLDRGFGAFARGFGAEPWTFSPLVRVADLRRIDYFTSFPHLVSFPAAPAPDAIERFRTGNAAHVEGALVVPSLDPVDRVLAPAACYALYPALRGRDLGDATYVATTVGTCFRREASYTALERLPSFRMREVIHVGTAASAKAFLETARDRVVALATAWGVALAYDAATDPFFDPQRSSKYVHQKLFPTKHEMCCGGVALGSFNLHRNFFGEAFELRAGGEAAHTACVAFGIERWVGAVVRAHGSDPASWPGDLAEDAR